MLIHWIVLTIALLIVSHLYSGFQISDLPTAIVASAVLGILNALVRPVLQFFALPITFLTLGLFYFVINGLMLYWTAALVKGVVVRSFWAAVLASILISLCSLLLNALFAGPR
jgi:putative membrane protein